MISEYELIEVLGKLPIDFRVETVVADLRHNGFNEVEIFVNPVGLFKRRFNKDVLAAELKEFSNYQQALFISTPREGLYDMLPQILFHNAPSKSALKTESVHTMIESYKRRLQEEKDARLFFLAYEVEFYKQRINNARFEQSLLESIFYKMKDNEVLSYWNFPKIFNDRQKGILFYIMPILHKIRGIIPQMESIYKLITLQNITIELTYKGRYDFNNKEYSLGKWTLSANSILRGGYNHYLPKYIIHANNISTDEILNFLPGSSGYQIIEKLNQYFIPFHSEAEIVIHANSTPFILKAENANYSRLGYSLEI